MDLLGHRGGQAGHLLRGGLRRRDDVHLAPRQVLAEAERDVAGAGRHVDEEEVGLVPEHVGQELLERLVQHRAAPDDGLALGHEVADRDAADAPRLGREQHLVDHDRIAVGAEHARDRVAVDVGVDDADRVAALRERDREVVVTLDLPTPPLPDEMSSGRVFEPVSAKGIRRPSAWPCACAVPALAPGSPCSRIRSASRSSSVITVKSRFTLRTPGKGRHCAADPVLDLVAQRAPGDRQGDEDAYVAVGADVDVADHAEVDDGAAELGILDRTQGLDDLIG